jgi:hypothetical protein
MRWSKVCVWTDHHPIKCPNATNLGAGGIYRVERRTSISQYWIRLGVRQQFAIEPHCKSGRSGCAVNRFLKNLSSKRTYDDVQPFLSD